MAPVNLRRSIAAWVVLVTGVTLTARSAEPGWLCTWFNHCVYESPGFRVTVVDKNTGQPLADVHALAEWILYGSHGRNGPLMVQDAVSSPDGVLTFPAWGPLQGSRMGLYLNHDPAMTLFKPGYKVLLVQNAVPIGTDPTDRVRGLRQDGKTFELDPFKGTSEQWVEQLGKAAHPGLHGRVSDDQLLPFRHAFLNRMRRIWAELATLPQQRHDVAALVRSVDEDLKFYGDN